MSIGDRLFGRKGRVELDLAALQACLSAGVLRHAGRPVDADLVRARLADGCRDAALVPLLPADFDALARNLDEEAWRRLALLIDLLDLPGVRAVLAPLGERRPVAEVFTGLARETALLTLELLRQSPLRIEELARRFVAALGAVVRGEVASVSRERLGRLDYGRLLAEAEKARAGAAARVEELRQRQEEQERRRPRRGKW